MKQEKLTSLFGFQQARKGEGEDGWRPGSRIGGKVQARCSELISWLADGGWM